MTAMKYPDRIRPPMPQWQIDAITAQCITTVYPDDWTPVILKKGERHADGS